MKKTVKNLANVLGAIIIALLVFTFWKKDEPIYVEAPVLKLEELNAKEAALKKEAKEAAAAERARRMYSCKVNEDCIIVDKDICGCLIGPKGVTAINLNYTVDFNAMQSKASMSKSCPETAPSRKRECSPSARAVCQSRQCKIVY